MKMINVLKDHYYEWISFIIALMWGNQKECIPERVGEDLPFTAEQNF